MGLPDRRQGGDACAFRRIAPQPVGDLNALVRGENHLRHGFCRGQAGIVEETKCAFVFLGQFRFEGGADLLGFALTAFPVRCAAARQQIPYGRRSAQCPACISGRTRFHRIFRGVVPDQARPPEPMRAARTSGAPPLGRARRRGARPHRPSTSTRRCAWRNSPSSLPPDWFSPSVSPSPSADFSGLFAFRSSG